MTNRNTDLGKIERETPHTAKTKPTKIDGEGSYTASKNYADSVDEFMDSKGQEIEKLAKQAATDIDNDKSGELQKAEKTGQSHAKN